MSAKAMAGVVLAGGESRRFGSDKAFAMFDGRTLFDRAVSAVGGTCSPVLVVAPSGRILPATPAAFERIDDSFPGEGPLPALLAAFERLGRGFAFVTACDAPLLTAEAIAAIGRPDGSSAVRAAVVEGRVQSLMAVYRVQKALPVLKKLLDQGERRLTALFDCSPIELFEPALSALHAYRSANTREELHALEMLHRPQSGSGAGGPG